VTLPVLPTATPFKALTFDLKSSDATICRLAASSFLTIGTGVPAGAISANQVCATTSSTPASASVGTFGRSDRRGGTVRASGRRLPETICGMTAGASTKPKEVCPPSRLVIDSLLLR